MISVKEKIKRLSAVLKAGDLVYVENMDEVNHAYRGTVFTVAGPATAGRIPIILPENYGMFTVEPIHLERWRIAPEYLSKKFAIIPLTYCQPTRPI